jgi:hypothetical protein
MARMPPSEQDVRPSSFRRGSKPRKLVQPATLPSDFESVHRRLDEAALKVRQRAAITRALTARETGVIEEFADTSVKTGYSQIATLGGELRIVKDSEKGEAKSPTKATAGSDALEAIEKASAQHQAAHLAAIKALASKLTPLLNQYIESCDQTTIAGQRELCEFVRQVCHANNIAVQCPKTGLPTAVFANPRPERKNPLRVVFRRGNHETYSETSLRHLVLIPVSSVAEGYVQRTAASKIEAKQTKR